MQKNKTIINMNNPALAFITQTEEERNGIEPEAKVIKEPAKEVIKEDNDNEKYATKVTLMTKASLRDKLRAYSGYSGESVNSLINTAIEEFINEHKDEIAKYNDMKGNK